MKEKTIKAVECVKLCMFCKSRTVRNGSVVCCSRACIERYMATNFPKSVQVRTVLPAQGRVLTLRKSNFQAIFGGFTAEPFMTWKISAKHYGRLFLKCGESGVRTILQPLVWRYHLSRLRNLKSQGSCLPRVSQRIA